MAVYTSLLRTLDAQRFVDLVLACPRQAREGFFARHQIRAPKPTRAQVHVANKNATRGQALWEKLQHCDDEPLAEELLRVLLLSHRPLLACACDALQIPHEEGLTNDPALKKFAHLTDAEADALVQRLLTSGVDGAVLAPLYIAFMRAQMQNDSE